MSKKRKKKTPPRKQLAAVPKDQCEELVVSRLVSDHGSSPPPQPEELQAFNLQLQRAFEEEVSSIEAELSQFEPLTLLSTSSLYFLFGASERSDRGSDVLKVQQFHIELLQALTLRRGQGEFPWFPMVTDFTQLLESVEAVSHLFWLKRIEVPEGEDDWAFHSLREDLRLHTQAVRNWSYPRQLEQAVMDLFGPFDDRAEAQIGLKPTRIFQLWLRIIETVEQRSRLHLNKLTKIARAKSAAQIFEYGAGGADSNQLAEEAMKIAELMYPGITIEQLKEMEIRRQNIDIQAIYSFKLEDICELYGEPCSQSAIMAVMDFVSLRFGDLAGQNPEHCFMGNPIWEKPCILLEGGEYFIPMPTLFLGFGLEILEKLVLQHETLTKGFYARRAKFLEGALVSLFETALPGCRCYAGSLGHGEDEFENDLLVLIDHVGIIVEAKAGGVNLRARRGEPGPLKTDIRELVVNPAKQSSRFRSILESQPGVHVFTSRSGGVNRFDTTHVKEFIRLSVNLHSMGAVYGGWQGLLRADLVPGDLDPTPTMSLFDLQCVCELLEGPCQILHYLARRADLERNLLYEGQEMDLLALYLCTGFNIKNIEFDSGVLVIRGLGKRFDEYFMRHESGRNVRKPKLRSGKWWATLLRTTEARRHNGWTRLGMALLTIPFETQVSFEKEFSATQRVVRKFGKNDGVISLRYQDTGPKQRLLALSGHAYRNSMVNDYESRVLGPLEQVFAKVKAKRVLFIGVNVESGKNPWDDLCVALRPDDIPTAN